MPDPRLTTRELQVLRASVRHHGSAKAVAGELGLATQSVYNVRRGAYAKLGAQGLTDALERLGWLRLPHE